MISPEKREEAVRQAVEYLLEDEPDVGGNVAGIAISIIEALDETGWDLVWPDTTPETDISFWNPDERN